MNISVLGKEVMSDEELTGLRYSLRSRKGRIGYAGPTNRDRHPIQSVRTSIGAGNSYLHGELTDTIRSDRKGHELPGTFFKIVSSGSGHSVSIVALALRDANQTNPSKEEILEGLLTLIVPAYRFNLWNETDGRSGVWIMEYPGGGLGNLSPEEGAASELGQETGLYADDMQEVSYDAVARGLSNEIMHTMIATNLREATVAEAAGADDNDLMGDPVWVTQKQFKELARMGIIADTQTKTGNLTMLGWLDDPANRYHLVK